MIFMRGADVHHPNHDYHKKSAFHFRVGSSLISPTIFPRVTFLHKPFSISYKSVVLSVRGKVTVRVMREPFLLTSIFILSPAFALLTTC